MSNSQRTWRKWTDDDDEFLRALHAEGRDDCVIGDIMGRNRNLVNIHRHKLGLPTIGQGGSKGYKHTPEAKARIGAAARQRRQDEKFKAMAMRGLLENGGAERGRENIQRIRFRRPPPGPTRQLYHKLRDNLGIEPARNYMQQVMPEKF